MFEFNKNNLSYRAEFANDVCKLLVKNHNNDIELSIQHVEKIYNYFEEYVRNIYEIIGDEIPLFALYRLKKHGADNYGFTDEEYEVNIKKCIEACKNFYIE